MESPTKLRSSGGSPAGDGTAATGPVGPEGAALIPMILVVDCSNLAPSAAVFKESAVAGSVIGTVDAGSVETVLEVCRAALGSAGVDQNSVNIVGAAVGPGSFTGIRTAISCASGLAAGWNVPAVGISSTLAAAIDCVLNGVRGEVAVIAPANPREDFFCRFQVSGDRTPSIVASSSVLTIEKGTCAEVAPDAQVIELGPKLEGKDLPITASLAARAIGALVNREVAFDPGVDGSAHYQLIQPNEQAALSPVYGKPVNAKTLAERGKPLSL